MAMITRIGAGEVAGEDEELIVEIPWGIVTTIIVLLFQKEADVGGVELEASSGTPRAPHMGSDRIRGCFGWCHRVEGAEVL